MQQPGPAVGGPFGVAAQQRFGALQLCQALRARAVRQVSNRRTVPVPLLRSMGLARQDGEIYASPMRGPFRDF
jgi:hypothetical protein